VIAEAMSQNVVALHAANRMLDKDADLTQGGIGSLLHCAQLRIGIFFALARLLHWNLNLIATIVRLNAEITSIASNIDVCKPVQLRRSFLFQHVVIMVVAAQCPTEKNNKLVRESHDGVLQHMPLFFPL
jgi:serine acetyltransferase